MMEFQIQKVSSNWEVASPRVSVVVPVFNRTKTVLRTLSSLERQSFRSFECIVVDDGSQDDIDSKMVEAFKICTFPMMYVKKKWGGVHTARNIGISLARGEMTTLLDSDDEFVETGIETMLNAWDNMIPQKDKTQYVGVRALCRYGEGDIVGDLFPDTINNLSARESYELKKSLRAEHIELVYTTVLKDNPWPEPEGISFVNEGIIWGKIYNKFKAYHINKVVRVYHTDSGNSITYNKKRNLQYCKNTQWNMAYTLNNCQLYFRKRSSALETIFLERVFCNILCLCGERNKLVLTKKIKMLSAIFQVPAFFVAIYYKKKKMVYFE